jgi:rSAM/selenodomain-associated transferase 2
MAYDGHVHLSVIIPALNEAECIGHAVDSAWQAGAEEVLVADGGSSDATTRIAAARQAKVISAPRGRATQQNAAAQQASGDVLLFLHADNWLEGAIAAQIRRSLAKSPRVHGALRQRIDASGFVYRWLERGNAERVRWLGLPYGDQAIFVRRDAFLTAGGFPDVPLMEDVLFMQRLRRRAWPLLLPGPVHVSARRWQRHGVIRQTIRNWTLLAAFAAGVSPARLARHYRRHDE